MEHSKRGLAALEASDATTALTEFTKALLEHPASPDYFVQRSTAYARLSPPLHDLALQDAEYAVLLGRKRGKRDKIQAGQQRRVVALYQIGRYADAKFILNTMQKWRPKDSKKDKMEHDMWMAKIQGKLKTADQTVLVNEYPDLEVPDEKEMRKILQGQLGGEGVDPLISKESSSKPGSTETKAASQIKSGASTTPAPAPKPTPASAPQKIRHEWYQNNQNVLVTLYAKGVPQAQIDAEIEEDSVTISFPHPATTSSTFTFTLDPLYALINSSASSFKVMATKIELTLVKSAPGQKWPTLEGTEPLKKSTNTEASDNAAKATVLSTLDHSEPTQQRLSSSVISNNGPAYPTSSKSGPKNWDKLATDLTKSSTKKSKKGKQQASGGKSDDSSGEEENYESDEGGDAVDGFFKKLYAGADADTRRAMMKSFQESNGTSLSTNWEEVGKGRVEPVKSKDDD